MDGEESETRASPDVGKASYSAFHSAFQTAFLFSNEITLCFRCVQYGLNTSNTSMPLRTFKVTSTKN